METKNPNRFYTKLVECGLASGTHGLPNLLRTSQKSIKLIWLVSILISLFVCTGMIYYSLSQYLQFETTSKIQVVYDSALVIPVITVCSSNYFASAESKQMIQTYYTQLNRRNMTTVKDFEQVYNITDHDRSNIQPSLMSLKQVLRSPSTNDSVKFQMGQGNFVIDCFMSFKPCPDSLRVWFFDFYFGNCFRINSGLDAEKQAVDVYSQREPGHLYGLKMSLFLGLPCDEFTDFFNIDNTRGLVVIIDDQSSLPKSDETFVSVRPGTSAKIALKKQVQLSLPAPYTICVTDELYTAQFKSEFIFRKLKYSKKTCDLFCKQKTIIDKCHCTHGFYPVITSSGLNRTRFCMEVKDFDCSSGVMKNFDISRCDESCPPECESTSYEVSVSADSYVNNRLKSNKMIVDAFAQQNISYITNEQLQETVASVFIFFADIKHTIITQSEARTIIDLLNGVAGLFGLFTGASVLTFVELVELGVELTCMLFVKKKRATSVTQKDNVSIFVPAKRV